MSASLRDFYVAGYSVEDPVLAQRLGRWRALGARSKADHVVALCSRAASVLDIGCGDGALLAELASRGFADVYDGIELSPTATALARGRGIEGVRRIAEFDGATIAAANGAYALAILSHVLEHVPEPVALLREAARVGEAVLIEVPLEGNRSARRPAKIAAARSIGHLHAFSRAAVHRLATEAGLCVAAELGDPLGRAHHAFFAEGPRARLTAAAKWALRTAAWRAAPGVAERAFTVHYVARLEPPATSRAASRPGR